MTDAITRRAYARLGLMGNPMDALGGPALAVTISDLYAEVALEPADCLCLIEPEQELPVWKDAEDFLRHIQRRGHHGGRRLMTGLLARIIRQARDRGIAIPEENFSLTWRSTIPMRVGLGGSSALLVAAMRAILEFWRIEMSEEEQIDLVLRAETEELGIPAGYMDRVAQVCEGLVFFEQEIQEEPPPTAREPKNQAGAGVDTQVVPQDQASQDAPPQTTIYKPIPKPPRAIPNPSGVRIERMDAAALPPLFVAIDEEAAEGTEVFHSSLRERHAWGDPLVAEARERLAELARRARELLLAGQGAEIGVLMDENFEIRRHLMHLPSRQEAMVDAARDLGAHAKFTGSGGAIVGTCAEPKIEKVIEGLRRLGLRAFRPVIALPGAE